MSKTPEKTPPTSNSAPQTRELKPLPQILPPPTTVSVPFDRDSEISLIINSMFVEFSEIQASSSPLEKYSLNELESQFKEYLINPPKISEIEVDRDLKRFYKDDFNSDEDFVLLSFINSKEENFEEYLKDWLYLFRPNRSIDELRKRLDEIKEWSNEQIDQFYDDYSVQILNEKLFADSTLPSCDKPILYTHSRCSYDPVEKIQQSEEIDNEISILTPQVQCFLKDPKFDNCLAILRSEKLEFQMRSEAIMIGRGSADQIVDVELNFVSEKPCVHISRNQAIISFLEDCNFYIENCGNRAFRVNGIIIPVGGMAILPPNALLDFSDSLLIFIPNTKFVQEIKHAMENPQTNSKSRKRND